VIEIDERTMRAIIRVQALIRGFLTRKLIYEHLQQMVAQNELNQQMYGEEEDNDEVEDDGAEDDAAENENQMDLYDEDGNPLYQAQ
jgi:IQ calmodulin-binding motif